MSDTPSPPETFEDLVRRICALIPREMPTLADTPASGFAETGYLIGGWRPGFEPRWPEDFSPAERERGLALVRSVLTAATAAGVRIVPAQMTPAQFEAAGPDLIASANEDILLRSHVEAAYAKALEATPFAPDRSKPTPLRPRAKPRR